MKDKKQIVMNILGGVLLAVIAVVVIIAVIAWKDKTAFSQKQTADAGQTTDVAAAEKWQEGDVSYNGKQYRYNTSVRTYLFLGIDKKGTVEESMGGFSGGQSDAMFLLVTDADNEKMSVISINRNTMTTVDVYDLMDNPIRQEEMQICLQHAYGDGGRSSCTRTVDAVSRLFYNIPVNGYVSLNMDGIPILNDAVGGVTVEVMDDLENRSLGVSLKAGETVTLDGNEAYVYIRSRDINEFDSASRRLERQEQYLWQLFVQIQKKALTSKRSILEIHDKVEDYLVASIDFVQLAEDVSEYEFIEEQMYTLPGETVMGEIYEEFYIDEDAFYEMMLEIFYKEV